MHLSISKTISKYRFRFYKAMAELSTPIFFYKDKVPQYDHNAWEKKNRYLNRIGFDISNKVAIDKGFEFIRPAGISIGEYSSIGKNFKCYNYNDVTVGKFCVFAGEVQINNGGHKIENYLPFSGATTIGNGVWIGHGVKIVGDNINIGNNSIVGAGTLVLESIPENSIVVGTPGKVVGKRKVAEQVWHVDNFWYDPKTFKLLTNHDFS